jgi:hypothetical protein
MGWDLWILYNSDVENHIVLPYHATQVHLLVHAIDVTIFPDLELKFFKKIWTIAKAQWIKGLANKPNIYENTF